MSKISTKDRALIGTRINVMGIKKAYIASTLGVTSETVSRWLSGGHGISEANLKSLKKLLSI